MSVTTRNPLRMAGAIVFSGGPNTGELRTTRGGEIVYTSFSGVAADTMVFSGQGRLNTVTRLTVASGTGIVIYDGVVATSGGPFSTSGHQILATLLQPTIPTVSGLTMNFPGYGIPIAVDMPFASGLVVAPIGSGTPAFCLSYTQSINPAVG